MLTDDGEHQVQGAMLDVGMRAPDFRVIANDLSPRSLTDYAGKVKIFSVIPSIDTRVCALQTRRFNQEAAALGDEVAVLTISADLPYALRRYCANEGIENTETLSTYRDMQFADAYGVHDTVWRLCQRAVFVLDREDTIRHAEYVYKMGDEVDFDSALQQAQALI
jgi:thiol peroxidase